MAGCPSEDEYVAFLDGRATDAAGLQEHIAGCSACFALLSAMGRAELGGSVSPALLQTAPLPGPPSPALPAGALAPPPARFEEYQLLRPLGSGAMGQVYLGHDTLLDRLVAIKFLADNHRRAASSSAIADGQQAWRAPESSAAVEPDDASRERFLVEARAIARLQHPHVVAIFRVGEAGGRPYLVSEFVPGKSLKELGKPVPWERALGIGLGLSRGLAAAHRKGVLHRDIKPANVILAEDGEAKLLDFGLAKLTEALPPLPGPAPVPQKGPPLLPWPAQSPALTGQGVLLGTPLYMAPEVWRGEPATRRSDVYSLGAVLYELCTGRPPHRGATLEEVWLAVQERDPSPLGVEVPGASPGFAAVVDRCLRRDPAARLGSGEELCLALEQLLPGPAVVAPAAPAELPGGNPYRGLYSFEAEHRAFFFGRGPEVRAVLALLREEPLVLVAGDSGAGKSSLCRAGVLPRVREGALGEHRSYAALSLVPGRRPMQALCGALAPVLDLPEEELGSLLRRQPESLGRTINRRRGDQAGVLIFIDQMEELCTQSDPAEAAQLGEVLGHLALRTPGVRVLLAARGDFLTRLGTATALAHELFRALYILGPLTPEALREAICGPARQLGFAFESEELVSELVGSTVQAEGGLPLLQFALGELWEERQPDRRVIPAAALHAIGGVAGALSRHADGVLARLLPEERHAARRILLKLVTQNGTRACRTGAELCSDPLVDHGVLEALVRGRLLLARARQDDLSGTAYELAHEALLQGWGTLRGWLAVDVELRHVQGRLEAAAAEWERLGLPDDALWSGPQLKEAEAVPLDTVNPLAAEFLVRSRRRAGRRRKARLGAVLGLVGLPLGLWLSAPAWRHRDEEAQKLEEVRQVELGIRAADLARRPGRETEALVAAVWAVGPGLGGRPAAQAVEGLSAAVTAGDRSLPLSGHGGQVLAATFSTDGRRVVTASADGTAAIWDARTAERLVVLVVPGGHRDELRGAVFSPDGTLVATAGTDHGARIFEAATGKQLLLLTGHAESVYEVAFSPDGARLVTASEDHTARVWDARTGAALAVLAGHAGPVYGVAFSPDGTRLLTASKDRTARVWDARPGTLGKPLGTLFGHLDGVVFARFSPDGTRVATASRDYTARLFDARTAAPLATLRGHGDWVRTVAFSPDGRHLVTASADQTARLWDAYTGELQLTLEGHAMALHTAAFSPDGARVVTASLDGTARLWDVRSTSSGTSGRPLDILQGHLGPVVQAAFSPDGARVVTASLDDTARVWDVAPGARGVTLPGPAGTILSAAFSGDGAQVAVAGTQHDVRLFDARTGELLRALSGHTGGVQSVAFLGGDRRRVVTASLDGTARVWDARTGQALATLQGPAGPLHGAAASPDGKTIVTAGGDGVVRVWSEDPAGGGLAWRAAAAATLRGHAGPVTAVAFSPDGRSVVSASKDGTARVWEVRTGEPSAIFTGHSGWVAAAAFSPDGSRVVTASWDGTARIWEVGKPRPVGILRGHSGPIQALALSPDGLLVATAGADQSARVFDARTGQGLATFIGPYTAVALSPDGRRLLLGGSEGAAQIVPAPLGLQASFARACELLRHQPAYPEVRGYCEP